jgi:D-sedoheptulose 7-phosphate isomerase
MRDIVEKHISKNIELLNELKTQIDVIVEIAGKFIEALRSGNKILLFGNGGSAADAQHIAAEFVGRFQLERKGLPAIALTTNTSSLTSIGNDYGFQDVFKRQIEALGKPGDLAVGISTSGSADNVLKGIEEAKKIGMITVGFTGSHGGSLKKLFDEKKSVDLIFIAPGQGTAHIQEMHIMAGHIICELVENELFQK